MHAILPLQIVVRALSNDFHRSILDPPTVPVVFRDNFGLPSCVTGVPRVHLHEVGQEERRLRATHA